MIASVEVIDRKDRKKRKVLYFQCAGYSDAQKTIQEMRKVTTSKMRLIDLKPV